MKREREGQTCRDVEGEFVPKEGIVRETSESWRAGGHKEYINLRRAEIYGMFHTHFDMNSFTNFRCILNVKNAYTQSKHSARPRQCSPLYIPTQQHNKVLTQPKPTAPPLATPC